MMMFHVYLTASRWITDFLKSVGPDKIKFFIFYLIFLSASRRITDFKKSSGPDKIMFFIF